MPNFALAPDALASMFAGGSDADAAQADALRARSLQPDLRYLPPTPDELAAEKQRALIEALGGQRAKAQLGILTGDRVLSGFGHAALKDVQEQEQNIQKDDAAQSAATSRGLAMSMAAEEKKKADARADAAAASLASERKIDNDRAERGLGIQQQLLGTTLAGLGIRVGADQRDAVKDARVEADKAKGEKLPSSAIMEMSDLPVAKKAIAGLGDLFGSLGMDSTTAKLSNAFIPDAIGRSLGTDVAKFNDAALLSMQSVGKIMEGGKLAAGDEAKYKSMLPRAGDALDVAKAKVSQAQAFLQSLYDGRVAALGKSGYNVSGLDSKATPAPSTPDIPASVKMQFPDGSTHDVPTTKIEIAKRKGAVEVK